MRTIGSSEKKGENIMTIEITKENKDIIAEALRLYLLKNLDEQKNFNADILELKERDKTAPKDEKDKLMREILTVESGERIVNRLKADARIAENLWETIRES